MWLRGLVVLDFGGSEGFGMRGWHGGSDGVFGGFWGMIHVRGMGGLVTTSYRNWEILCFYSVH